MTGAKKPTKKRYCIHSECKNLAENEGFCRLHYISNWKHIKFNRRVKAERRLNAYVDLIARKYPKDYVERIKDGLASDEKFRETVEELDFEARENTLETDREYMERFIRKIKVGE